MNLSVLLLLAAMVLVWPCRAVQAMEESCVECHLHRSIVDEFTSGTVVETLAGLHGREFAGDEPGRGCRSCHGERQKEGKLPAAAACLGCHTRGKTAQGEEEEVFHAEKDHWPMEKVTCTDCHKGHVRGNPAIKFLTTDVITVCGRCHEKTLGRGAYAKDRSPGELERVE